MKRMNCRKIIKSQILWWIYIYFDGSPKYRKRKVKFEKGKVLMTICWFWR